MKVQLIAHTPDPEAIVAMAAKVCYSPLTMDDIIRNAMDDDAEYIGKIVRMGHESPIEHASFTFAIEGVSRALLAQLTRHRIASYSVRSQRYVREADFGYVVPPEIAGDERARGYFDNAIFSANLEYRLLVNRLMELHEERGMAKSYARKKAQEDARFVLPNACETQLIMTMNARELLHFFSMRCCNRAQWEIRSLADEMLRLCKGVAPHIFEMAGPACVRGKCPEGEMSCGESDSMRLKYMELGE